MSREMSVGRLGCRLEGAEVDRVDVSGVFWDGW